MKFSTTLKEDCIGEYKIYRYTLELVITDNLLERFLDFGEFKLYKNFPKPYFSIKSVNVIIKGILDENELEVTFFEYNNSCFKTQFETILRIFKAS